MPPRPIPFAKVPREWGGETAFIIAGGPSVAGEDVSRLQGRRVIVVNSSYAVAPFADILFFGDSRWWIEHRARLAGFAGRMVTCSNGARGDRLLHLRKVRPPPGITFDPGAVAMSRTSLQGAMNVAVHLGVARIVLIGADMQPARDGRSHHHQPHPWPVRTGCWAEQMKDLRHAAAPLAERGVEVVNASPRSLITWWPQRRMEEVL